MNIEKLKLEVLEKIDSESCSAQVYLILKKDSNKSIKKADIEAGQTIDEFKKMFSESLRNTIIENSEASIVELSAADERANAIYHYDYKSYPEELEIINNFDIQEAVNYPFFSFAEDNLQNLIGFIIYLGNMNSGIVLYKKHYSISLIKSDAFLLCGNSLFKNPKRFVKFEGEDILRINGDVHLMKINGEIYILNLNVLEKNLGFKELINKNSKDAIEEICASGLLENKEALLNASNEFSFAKKLAKTKKSSPILKMNIPNKHIIEFSKIYPSLKDKFKYSEDGLMIRLDTKESKTAFLKLLNDDFLNSDLTKLKYDSLAKDNVEDNF